MDNIKIDKNKLLGIGSFTFIIICMLYIHGYITNQEYSTLGIITVIVLGISMLFCIEYINENYDFKHVYKYRYLLLIVVFLVSIFVFKINFSSIRSYENVLTNNIKEVKEMQIGVIRGVRSDEWGVQTPLQLAQEKNDYNQMTSVLGERFSMLIYSTRVPIKHISIIAQPSLWGYLLFGSEIGFSWYYVSRILILMLFSYKLVNILTKDKKLSYIGSFIISFSPTIQWWFSNNVDVVIYWQIILVSLYEIFCNDNKRKKIIYTILLFMGMIGFTLKLYPPFQVALFYLGIALLIGIYFENKESVKFTKANFMLLMLVIIGYIVVIGITISDMLPEINKVLNTVYPGKRQTFGGRLSLEQLFNYIPTLLLPFKNTTYSNACEISSAITIFPIPIIIYFLQHRKCKSPIINSLIVFIICSLIFMFVSIPSFFAKITLLSFLTEARLYFVFCLANTLLIICIVKKYNEIVEKKYIYAQIILYIVLISIIFTKYNRVTTYLGVKIILISTLLILALIYFINTNKKRFFNILLIVTIITGATVNPIKFGIKEMTDTNIALNMRQIDESDPGMWVTIDDIWLSKYILAQGIQTLNALSYPPKIDTWEKLDVNKEFNNSYNRYAHVKVNLYESCETRFKTIQGDLFQLDTTYQNIKDIGVKYIVTRTKFQYDNIELIHSDLADNIYIYKVF